MVGQLIYASRKQPKLNSSSHTVDVLPTCAGRANEFFMQIGFVDRDVAADRYCHRYFLTRSGWWYYASPEIEWRWRRTPPPRTPLPQLTISISRVAFGVAVQSNQLATPNAGFWFRNEPLLARSAHALRASMRMPRNREDTDAKLLFLL